MFVSTVFLLTFDINEAIEESNGFEGEKMSHVFHSNFERVPVIKLQVCVNREAEILLNLFTQLVQQVLFNNKMGENQHYFWGFVCCFESGCSFLPH